MKKLPKKAIVFDAEDVIYYRDEDTLRPITDFFAEKGCNVAAEQFMAAYGKHRLDAFKGKISKDDHLKKTLELLGVKFDESFFNEFAKVFREKYSSIKVNEKIFAVFENLKKNNFKIAVLTDTFSSKEKRMMDFKKIGVDKFIDVVVCSSESGFTKDEREAFEAVLKELNLNAREVIFVGHQAYEIQGAKKAGVTAVSLKKGCGEDFFIKDVSGLLQLIKKL